MVLLWFPPDWETKMMKGLTPSIYNHTMGDILAHESRHAGTLNDAVLNYDKNALGELKSMSKAHDYSPMEMRDYISHEQQNLFKNKGSRITNPEDWGKYFDEHTNARPDNGFLKNTWNKLTTPAPVNAPGTIDSERMWDKLRELKGSNPSLFDKIKQWQMEVSPGIVDNNVIDKIGAPIIDNKIFRNRTATSFNRHSPMDQFNADRIKNKLEPFNFKEWQNRNKKPALLGSLPANIFSKQLNPAPIGPPPMVANSIKEPPLNFADTPKPTAPSLDQQFNPAPVEPPKQQAQISPKEFNFAPTPTLANPPEPDFVQQTLQQNIPTAYTLPSTPEAGTITDKLKTIATSPNALNIGKGAFAGGVVGNVSSDQNKTRNTFLGAAAGGTAAALNQRPQNVVIPQPQELISQPQGSIPQPQAGTITDKLKAKAPGLIDQAKARLKNDPAVTMVDKYKQPHGGYLAQLAGFGSSPNLTGPETAVQGSIIDGLIKYRKPIMQGTQFLKDHSGDVDALGSKLQEFGDKFKIPAASNASASLTGPTSPEMQAKIDELKSGIGEKVKNEVAGAVTSPAAVRAAAPKIVNTTASLAAKILPTVAPALKGLGSFLGKASPLAFAGSLLNEGRTAANYPGGTAAYMQEGRDINELPFTKGNYMAGVLQNWAHPGRTLALAGEGLTNKETYKGLADAVGIPENVSKPVVNGASWAWNNTAVPVGEGISAGYKGFDNYLENNINRAPIKPLDPAAQRIVSEKNRAQFHARGSVAPGFNRPAQGNR